MSIPKSSTLGHLPCSQTPRWRSIHSLVQLQLRRSRLEKRPFFGKIDCLNILSLGTWPSNTDVNYQNHREMRKHEPTSGISTPMSTPNSPSLPLTTTLFGQLPIIKISDGFSNDTFQLVSSVGRGRTNG